MLHIGSGKTGTTSVQLMLDQNRDRLREYGLLYPRSPGHRRHVKLGLSVRSEESLEKQVSWHRQRAASPEQFQRQVLEDLRAEIAAAGLPRVLVSDEALYALPHDAIQRLRGFADTVARRTRIVVYLRRQDDHMRSRYQQVVKVGEVRRMAARVEQLDMSSTYDYHARLKTWQQAFEPDEFEVRRFERSAFLGGSLYDDFLDAVGFEDKPDLVPPERARNESLDAESVEFLRILNMYRVEHEGARPGVIDNRATVARLVPAATGPVLTLPDHLLEAFTARYEASNEAVAREYLGDPTGQLFHAEQRSVESTTEQRLDPVRLDHFLELAEIPAPMHDALRRLAEQEASSWRAADVGGSDHRPS